MSSRLRRAAIMCNIVSALDEPLDWVDEDENDPNWIATQARAVERALIEQGVLTEVEQ